MSTAWEDWNFTEGVQDIVRRIQSVAQAQGSAWARIVATRDDITDITEEQQVTPGVYVIYRGFAVVGKATTLQATLEHRFAIVLAVSVANPGKDVTARTQEAGRYLPSLLKTLHGYIPAGCTTPLVPVTPPAPWGKGKFSYYPLVFASEAIYTTRKGPANGPLPLDRRV